MKRLLLLRHAKAEPGTAEQDDFDRALNARGLADATAMAQYLVDHGYGPSRILCSTALRTRQTAAAVLERVVAPIECLDSLYLAPPGRIISLIQDAADTDAVLMVVGHNPGLEQCAALLAREPVKPREQARHELLDEKFPTAALAVLDFDIPGWRKMSTCDGRLVDFVRPRDL